ncbi:hypothetical protein LQ327_09600 [Actinomycetospora endophytica]|uniref:GNAT family N-acetyltransferase n=1 Tax=Actinomycetospora endophytica TaxID=2291215 RepID=A0ABS8P5V0_9PSEU|nr:hypothetical protein [Actinomycetospora endophytica]MCD2193635.1 hypothetical protein [Actinomycetospora endophytica]
MSVRFAEPGWSATAGRQLRYAVPGTAHHVLVTAPAAGPELWRSYLEGAERVYRSYGVEAALDVTEADTSLVFVAVTREGEPVGGMRAQGPYATADQAQALHVWDGEPRVRALIEERLPFGVVESKGLWVAPDVPDRRALVACFGRAPVQASTILGARYALGTTAEHTERLWTSTGAVLARDVPPIGYPDGRYRTHLMFWDRWGWPAGVSAQEKHAIDVETAQLLDARVPSPRPAPGPR